MAGTSLDKQAREYFKSGGNGFESGGDEHERAFSCSFDYMVESAAAFATQVREQSKWVSVASELPAENSRVWVWDVGWGTAYEAIYDEDGWTPLADREPPINITQWQSLPIQPEGQ